MLCTFLLWSYTYMTSTTVRHEQPCKCSSSLWKKNKTSKVSHHAHGALLKKREGKTIRSKVYMTDKSHCLHMHMIKVYEWHCYLETLCLNLQNKWKRWAHTFVIIQEREALPWENHTPWASKSLSFFKNLKTLQAPKRKRLALILGDKFWGSIDKSEDVSHLESKVCKES